VQSTTTNDASGTEPVPNNADFILARKLQKVMMPSVLPALEELEIGAKFFPSLRAGGDLFDVMRISDSEIGFLLFDVASNGIRPVLVSAMAKICFVNHIRQGVLPYAVVERVNGELLRHVGESLLLTAFVGYLDLHDNKLTYCNTGFATPAVFRRQSGILEALTGHHAEIGVDKETCFEEQYVYLQQGDCLILYTDGLYRLFTGQGDTESHRTEAFIRNCLLTSTAGGLLQRIEDQHAFVQSRVAITDDISFICAEVLTQSRKNQIKDRLGFKIEDKVYLQFLSYLEEMDRTTSTILAALDIAGFKDEDIRKMKIICTELLVNAIVHGNRRDHSKKVVVGHLIDKNQATVSIMDEGAGFNPHGIPDPTLPENLEKPCGRGLFIVQHYVESIEFNEIGNRVTIIKKNCSQ
jgi:serine/threonine-protein kinase RsbW